MVKKEVISIHIGQAGCQIGTAFWELYLLEHGIGPDGYSTLKADFEDTTFESFFEDVSDNRFVPRTLFLDSESNVIDEIRYGVYRNLFHPDQLISGNEDGGNNFARGSFMLGNRHMLLFLDKVRKSVEACEDLEGFMINHSFGGGTGSGLTSVILHALTVEFTKTSRIQVPIYPGTALSTSLVEPYNVIFHVHSSMEATDLAFIYDNESMYEILRRWLNIHSPNFTNLNRLLALVNSSITCTMRFPGTLNSDLTCIQTNLIPYPRIHFPVVAHVPLIHESKLSHCSLNMRQLLNDAFSNDYLLSNVHLSRGKFIAVMLNARGLIAPMEMNEHVQRIKERHDLSFVEWSPNGFKICLNNQTPQVVPESGFATTEKSISMICNSTSVRECWFTMARKFDLLFEKRAFVHWYVGEGMEENEFFESRYDIGLLTEDYNEISMTESALLEELKMRDTLETNENTEETEETEEIP